MNRHACSYGKRQRGVGLIEVLMAVLVVSIGFLGVAALQVMSLSTNNSAMGRSMATMSTYSILDAMRADRSNALAGHYNQTVTANACSNGAGTTLYGNQLAQWCQQLGHNLGAAKTTTGTVNCTTAG
ncbi:MAG TPA: type IV pilus modification protein PilV, partial [Rhodanobacteraceae bacterium]